MRPLVCATALLAWALLGPFEGNAEPRTARALSSCAGFTSPEDMLTILTDLALTHPDIAQLHIAGHSGEGRPIPVLLIGLDLDAPSDEVTLRVLGGIHGDECQAAQTALDLAVWLVSGYDDGDALAAAWIEASRTVIAPLVNPDGYAATLATRHNAAGIDLNRNFSFASVAASARPFSEPETRAIRDLSRFGPFHLGVALHTVHEYINAPWNHTPHHPPDEALLELLMRAYAQDSGYKTTFGWDWYATYGDVNDWAYGTAGTFDFSVELRSDLDEELEVHAGGILALLEASATAIVGTVRDARTGAPLSARLELFPEGAVGFTAPASGWFRRIALPGTYAVTAHAAGYASLTSSVEVRDGQAATVHFDLVATPDAPRPALAVVGTRLPQVVPTYLNASTYLDDSLAFDALGPADGVVYSLKPGGELTLDLGEARPCAQARLELVSDGRQADRVAVDVALEQDGPFVTVGEGQGDATFDLDGTGLEAVRFVRLRDLTDGPFNSVQPGYDVDAVLLVAAPDSEEDTDESAEEPIVWTTAGAGCGCQTSGRPRATGSALLLGLLGF